MKAIRMHSFGAPEVLVYESIPEPQPGPGQVLIKVEAVAVNYADVLRRSNGPYPFPTSLPFTPGSEIAGTIAALGAGVTAPPVGTPVFSLAGDAGSAGYAQYALANAAALIPIPAGLGMDEASALIVAGTTAMLMLRDVARLQPGENVFIPGAAGGVGGYLVQIAKLLGAGTIIGAASTAAKREQAIMLGADHAIDSRKDNWHDDVLAITGNRGVDVVFEMGGKATFGQSLRSLAPFGRAIIYGMTSLEPLTFDPATINAFFYNPALNQSLHVFNLGVWFGIRPEQAAGALQTLVGFVAEGKIHVPISHTLPLSQAPEAHRLMESRRSSGKIVLKPWLEA